MKTKQIRTLLNEEFGSSDDSGHVTFSKGVFTVRRGYFYHHGQTEANLVEDVLKVLPAATVVDSGDHYAPFRGGEGVRCNSHFFVKLTIKTDK